MLEAKRKIEESISAGLPRPDPLPTLLPLSAIRETPELFQHRLPPPNASEVHARELAKTPQAGFVLDPVTVFWSGRGWVNLDGHHRLRAYRLARWKQDVPVRVFEPTDVDAAIAHAGRANTGDKLNMTRGEKQRTAWRLTVATKLSRAKVVRASGVSDGMVAEMRRVKQALLDKGRSAQELSVMNWWEVRRANSGDDAGSDVDWEARMEQEAQELANKLIKAIGKRGQLRHEVLAIALEIYDRRLPDALRSHWGPLSSDDEFGEGEEQDF